MKGLFDDDEFNKVCKLIHRPKNYFEFPSSLIAFAHTFKTSNLLIVKDKIFFRQYGNSVTLIAYFCSGLELKTELDILKDKGFKLKVLNFCFGDTTGLIMKPYDNDYWVTGDYTIDKALEKHSSKTRSTIKRKIKKASQKYNIETVVNRYDALEVFNEWVEGAKKRHFMVMKGHYLAYLDRFFNNPHNISVIPFYNKEKKQLHGIAGYEVYGNQAQITLMKHRIGDNDFPAYFWTETINYILLNHPHIKKIYCGYTADELKQSLGFNYDKSFKFVL